MEKILLTLLIASSAFFMACNNEKATKQNGAEQHNEKMEHPKKDSMENSTDSLGMRMGGNELESKKK
mgnify:CR=1 FL=1